eukprot:2888088-Prymnesium_polylepis.2
MSTEPFRQAAATALPLGNIEQLLTCVRAKRDEHDSKDHTRAHGSRGSSVHLIRGFEGCGCLARAQVPQPNRTVKRAGREQRPSSRIVREREACRITRVDVPHAHVTVSGGRDDGVCGAEVKVGDRAVVTITCHGQFLRSGRLGAILGDAHVADGDHVVEAAEGDDVFGRVGVHRHRSDQRLVHVLQLALRHCVP